MMDTTRREFLKRSALALTAAPIAGAVYSGRATGEVAANEVSIRETGARGNGVADDTDAIYRAINEMYNAGGGVVKIPQTDKFFKTTRAIDLRSDLLHPVRIVGEGRNSYIRNVATGGDHAVRPTFRIGRLVSQSGPTSGPGQTYHKIAPAQKGQYRIRPRSGTFKRGDILLIASAEKMKHNSSAGYWWPKYPQIAVVMAVDGPELVLSDPLLDDQPEGVSIAKYRYGVSHGSIENLRFANHASASVGYGAIAGGGAYRMTFKRLTMSGGTSFVAANGLAYCVFEDINAKVARKGIETAYYTHSTRVSRATFRPMANINTNQMMLFAAESAHRVLFEHCDVDVTGQIPTELGDTWGVGGFLGGTRYCRIRDSVIRANRYPRGFSFYGVDSNKPSHSNLMVRCTVTAQGSGMAVNVLSGGPGAGKHIVKDSRLIGGGLSVQLGRDTTGCEIRDNYAPQAIRDWGTRQPRNIVSGNTS